MRVPAKDIARHFHQEPVIRDQISHDTSDSQSCLFRVSYDESAMPRKHDALRTLFGASPKRVEIFTGSLYWLAKKKSDLSL